MATIGLDLSETNLENLLLQHKYLTAVRRVARGVAHSYNNIFTGLGGQTAMLQQANALLGDLAGKRGELIDELLQRGISQTANLYGFTRDGETACGSQSPLLLASKAVELLNCISRVHRFVVESAIDQEKIIGNGRDIILLLFYLGENCVDATPEGGEISLSIGLAKDTTPATLAFTFRDHGPGCPDNVAASPGRSILPGPAGSALPGLGLYAARILAERHRGRLRISRDADHTTLASANFPVTGEGKKAQYPEILSDAGHMPGNTGLAKQCFLVVEDDEAMRTLLLNRLQRRGHMVFCVNTCAEAQEEYQHLHDIITTVLMDVGLRDGNGYECQRKLLAIKPGARIIFMSGQERETSPGGTTGNAAFLQKPFTLDQLEKAVRDVHL
ncbi:MAG: response regulator [Desulforhopalus sp.]|nr:response regulator [Desulforhopalus sp.]